MRPWWHIAIPHGDIRDERFDEGTQGPSPLVRVGEEHYVACYQFVGGDLP
jgi:hypothetical protein